MKFCPSCGTALAGASRFCANCGAALAVAPKPPAPPAGAAAPASPSAALPPLRPAKRQMNWPALVVGLLALALIAGGISFLLLRDDPATPTPTPTTTTTTNTTTTTLQP